MPYQIVDIDGVTQAPGSAAPARGVQVLGSDGTNARSLRTATDGTIRVDPTGTTSQPVTDNGGSLTVDASSWPLPTGASTAANQTTVIGHIDTLETLSTNIQAALDAIKDTAGVKKITDPLPAGTNNIGDVDVVSVPAPLSTAGGGTEAAALRVTIANDSTGLVSIDDNGGSLTVDASSWPLPTGAATSTNQSTIISHVDTLETLSTNIQAALDAIKDTAGIKKITDQLPAGTNNIGDVDIATVPAPLSTTGGGVEATALRVTIANDSTGLVSVDDNGGSLTIDTPQLPSALVGGRLTTNIGAWLGSTAPTVGQKTMLNSVPVVLASNQSSIPVTFTQSNARTGVSGAFLTLGGGTAGVRQIMRATTYTEPASSAQRSIASNSANDTAAGTGARTVQVIYFDDTGDGPFEETITLNGTTPVDLVNSPRFIESMQVTTAGSGQTNAGVITLYSATGGGGTVIGTIGVGNLVTGLGDNSTFWAHHYFALGYDGEISTLVAGVQSGGSATSARVYLQASYPLLANSAEVVVGGAVIVEGQFQRNYSFNPHIEGFARVTAYAIPYVNNATISVSFDWSEIPV